ncbi:MULTISPECIES: UPF0182 family protein [Protofrankia]|uniref:UPF0182 protein FrCorBMG51_09530 n=1 Tax=Protofrankia coriariae TaxID=1562887 RepID=A0ABR5F527_9ACTN|nr:MULTISPECIES: UPF0182 family protein [Protofrankia]KLL11752.1 membrane protein [Protofrankia coriariae]ONH38361.1 hypothetical protein BL254_00330 [Protofrankia sp. BMG5.30]
MAAARRPLVARTRILIPTLVVLIVLVVLLGVFTRVYTDLLFFRSVGFGKVFNTVLSTRILLFVIFGALMAVAVGANLLLAYRLRPSVRPLSLEQQNLERYRAAIEPYAVLILFGVSILFGIVAGVSASGRWRTWLLWRNGESFGQQDAQFHRDISYYAFTYPFQRFLLGFLLTIVVLSLLVTLVTHYLFGGIRLQTQGERVVPAAKVHISVLLGLLALLKAWAYYLDRFGLVFSSRGAVHGASYTDTHAVLPAKLILLFISLLCAVLFIYNIFQRGWTLPLLSAGILVLSALVVGGIYPAIVQQFQVRPNEASREAPYIARNIAATRAAYGIDQIRPQPYDASTTPDTTKLGADSATLSNARLLDPNVLSATYDQLQQIRGYYGFPASLDIDRYAIAGSDGREGTQDYVVSVRELDQGGLAPQQRNWINLHLTYTHGKGFVAAPANTVDSSGRPVFTEQNLPPTGPLNVRESRVYFGEMSPDYSIVGTRQAEIDGPGDAAGSQATTSYDGSGGVSIGSTFRRALFALRFQEKNILLSSDITDSSRILYVRNPRDRVSKVAPWLTLDGDPYPAVIDGRVTWILDGYTTTDGYPYAQRRTLDSVTADAVTTRVANRANQAANEVNYIRNSVKVTVDAYNGTVALYAWDEADPVLKTWMKAFPGSVKPKKDIPASLLSHLRYPEDLFKVQRDLLASYHVTDPREFYSQEDFWAVSPAPDDQNQTQPPFYVYSQLVGQSQPTFNLTSPLLARASSKLAAYMAVSSDPGSYGEFQVLQLPKGVTINGPVQVQNLIESNAKISQELNLLRGQGSRTIQGNLLTLPVAGGLLYVEPYYVQARENAVYPTLQRVAAVYGENIGFAPTLGEALSQVFGTTPDSTPGGGTGGTGGTGPESPPPGGGTNDPQIRQAITDADRAFTAGQDALRKDPPDFTAYGNAQKDLADALDRLGRLTAAPPPPSPPAGPEPPPSPPPAAAPDAAPAAPPTTVAPAGAPGG